jgi:hypothetical protein
VTFGEFVFFAKVDAVARFRTGARRCPLRGGARTPLSLTEREVIGVGDGLDARLLQFFGGAGMESWQVTDVLVNQSTAHQWIPHLPNSARDCGWSQPRARAAILDPRLLVYLIGREPVMRMSTSLLALCCQSGPDATWETPISARSRSNGSRSLRMSRLSIARFTSESIAPWI